MRQTCSCRCGASRLAVNGEPIGRFYCHCTICQAVYQQPYADVTIFRRGRSPCLTTAPPRSGLNRGTCPACAAPVVAFMALGPLRMFAFVRSHNFERPSELPEPSLHIFYHRRVADATDALPKVSGYWVSEMAVSRMIFGGAFRARRTA
jgi:hypothetical protein